MSVGSNENTATGSSVRITGKALAAMLGLAASAQEDMEGLLFGQCRNQNEILVESCLLVGATWSIGPCRQEGRSGAHVVTISADAYSLIATRKKETQQQLLGWCSMRSGFQGPKFGRETTYRELKLNCHLAHKFPDRPLIGCVVQRNAGVSKLGIFGLDAFWFAGSDMAPLNVQVVNVGATTAGAESCTLDSVPQLGLCTSTSASQEKLQACTASAAEAMKSFVAQAFEGMTPNHAEASGRKLRRAQFANQALEAEVLKELESPPEPPPQMRQPPQLLARTASSGVLPPPERRAPRRTSVSDVPASRPVTAAVSTVVSAAASAAASVVASAPASSSASSAQAAVAAQATAQRRVPVRERSRSREQFREHRRTAPGPAAPAPEAARTEDVVSTVAHAAASPSAAAAAPALASRSSGAAPSHDSSRPSGARIQAAKQGGQAQQAQQGLLPFIARAEKSGTTGSSDASALPPAASPAASAAQHAQPRQAHMKPEPQDVDALLAQQQQPRTEAQPQSQVHPAVGAGEEGRLLKRRPGGRGAGGGAGSGTGSARVFV